MTDDARRTLYCLVEDEHVVFKVIVLVNNHCLEDLKNLVQQEKKDGALGNVNTSDIILFKVTIAEVNTAMLQLTPFE
jgi:Crinkler effector protein N-terminal domain